MSANDRQVGGSYYRKKPNAVQHWSYCSAVDAPYLEGAATKYITRWRDKNGVQDLEKSVHVLEKRIEDYHQGIGRTKGANRQQALFNRFITDNDVPANERQIIDLILHWRNINQVIDAMSQLRDIIESETCGATPEYVNQDR